MMVTNCPNCGAVLKNNRCEYCGAVFNTETKDDLIKFIPIHKPCKVFRAGFEIPHEMISSLGEEETSKLTINELARSLADAIAPMMDLRTEYDPAHNSQHIVGTIRVIEPDYRF